MIVYIITLGITNTLIIGHQCHGHVPFNLLWSTSTDSTITWRVMILTRNGVVETPGSIRPIGHHLPGFFLAYKGKVCSKWQFTARWLPPNICQITMRPTVTFRKICCDHRKANTVLFALCGDSYLGVVPTWTLGSFRKGMVTLLGSGREQDTPPRLAKLYKWPSMLWPLSSRTFLEVHFPLSL